MSKKQFIARTRVEKAAYWQGFGCYRDGLEPFDNPFTAEQLEQRDCWLVGWVDSRIEESEAGGKKLRKSKLFWFGAAQIALAAVGYFQASQLADNYPQLAPIAIGASGFIIIILRFLTNQGIEAPKIVVRT